VAKKRIHGRRGTIRDSYNAPIAENVPVNTVFADASHRDAMALAATIATQLEMDRRDAVPQARGRQAVYLLKPTMLNIKVLKDGLFTMIDRSFDNLTPFYIASR